MVIDDALVKRPIDPGAVRGFSEKVFGAGNAAGISGGVDAEWGLPTLPTKSHLTDLGVSCQCEWDAVDPREGIDAGHAHEDREDRDVRQERIR